ncbi:MAG: hypothetical protein M1816_004120 [Peltula sp. TS41687]|nr:MAG: hypothetical protein M1816_004120 [Peltula sp. TS41687]
MARDACHYRRGQLEPSAIRNLMLLRHHDMTELEKEVFSQEDQQPNESSDDRTKVQADIQAAFEEEFISSDEELDDDELYDQELFQLTQQSQRGRNAQPNPRSTRFQRNENSQIDLERHLKVGCDEALENARRICWKDQARDQAQHSSEFNEQHIYEIPYALL